MIGWKCPLCRTRYWLRRSCAPCGMRIVMLAAFRSLDEEIEAARMAAVRRMASPPEVRN